MQFFYLPSPHGITTRQFYLLFHTSDAIFIGFYYRITTLMMERLLETYSVPGAWPWNSQTFEPGVLATYESILAEEVEYDEAYLAPPRTPEGVPVHHLPAEIWMVVCEALHRMDLIDATNQHKSEQAEYPELLRKTTNKKRPNLIITARSILPLSKTCRYLHKVTSPSLLEKIRFSPPYSISPDDPGYLSVVRQIKSLQLNDDQRLQHVKGFAVELPSRHFPEDHDREQKNELNSQIGKILLRLPNLRHLTVIGMKLDGYLMQTIPTLPLEHLWLWNVGPENPNADGSLLSSTPPRIKLRSLLVRESQRRGDTPISAKWIDQIIGPTMQDLDFDGDFLEASKLPSLPELKFLEVKGSSRAPRVSQTALSVLSKTPNLKEAVLELKVAPEYPPNSLPALNNLQRIVCHSTWLRYLVPGRSITTAKVLCDSRIPGEEFSEMLCEGNVPLRNLSLTYARVWPQGAWIPDDVEHVVRYFPELEIFRFRMQDPKVGSSTIN
ncbi:hypothetical protein FRC04_001184 [Tulasnella sp. 424]|nr:hypothetical protein FRC04_001184 [Tulasnella sp. 424]KAG8975797.1 hypothetical protein FRC05_005007 [Tulasnella sp. 425]